MVKSDDKHNDDLSNGSNNVELKDIVVPDSSDDLSDLDSDVEVGNHESSSSNREGLVIDNAMERISYFVSVDGKVKHVKDIV